MVAILEMPLLCWSWPPILVRCGLNATNIGALWIECHQYWCAVDGMPPILVRYCLDIGALWIECHQYWCAIVLILVRWRWNATNIGAILFEYWCAEDGMPLLCLCSVARMWPMLVRCRWNHSIGMPPICTRKKHIFWRRCFVALAVSTLMLRFLSQLTLHSKTPKQSPLRLCFKNKCHLMSFNILQNNQIWLF